jgi:hypothetical protein
MTELVKKLESVDDCESFFDFVRALIADRKFGQDEWENETIESFLEAALAWAEATKLGQIQGQSEELSWKSFATFLYCGKVYE